MVAERNPRTRRRRLGMIGGGAEGLIGRGHRYAARVDDSFELVAGAFSATAAIKAAGKELTTIYISCNDPDYYFSLRPIVEAFPNAKVIAKATTIEAITANGQGKLDVWGPQKLGRIVAIADVPRHLNRESTEIRR